MKKIVSMLILVILTMQVAIARDVITHDVNKLPAKARQVVKENFSASEISYIKIENERFRSKTYEVTFTDGSEIEFDKKGEWQEIDCKKKEVPSFFILPLIKQYIEQNFKGQFIVKIEKIRRGYEVELNNDLDLLFDVKGVFYGIDD